MIIETEIKNRAKANLKIYSLDEPWKMSLKTDSFPGRIEFNTKLQLNLNCSLRGFNDIYGKGELALTDVNLTHFKNEVNQAELRKFLLPRMLSVSFDLSADLNKELVKLKQLAAEIGDEKIFNITGELNQILTDPAINLQVVESEIKLHQLESIFLPLLPDTIRKQFEHLKIKGIASLTGTKVSGYPLGDSLNKSLLFDLNFAIQNLYADYAEPVSNLSNAKLQITTSGIYNLSGVQKIDLRMRMFIDSLSTFVDTTKFTFEKLSAELATSINEKFLPDSLRAFVKINNFFDVPLNFSINFKSEDGFNRYNAQANLSFSELPLAEITNSAADGAVDFALNVHSQQLDKIDAHVNIFSDIIEIAAEDEPIIIYPMDIIGNLKLSADTTLKYVKLDNLKMEINDFLNKMIQSSPNGIIAVDLQGNIMVWNPAAEEILGYKAKEVIGKMNIAKIYPGGEGEAKKMMQMMRSRKYGGAGILRSYPMVIVKRDGGIVEANFSAALIYGTDGKEVASVGIIVDVTDRLEMERKLRKTQEQLLQSEKLAAMGRLTSQIAHELNNPLYGIMNTLELMKTEISPENKRRKVLEMALSETMRLTELLRKMLSFSKPDEEEKQPTDINVILDEILLLHEKQLRENDIRVSSFLSSGLGKVYASKSQLRQVFLNMISNAKDAMPEGGTLTARTKAEGDNIHIEISDTGIGIKEDNINRIFDAFFTTKDGAKDVGLGLSVCYGFIKDHGGDVKVESEVGSGTTFTIILPVYKEAENEKILE